MRSMASAPPASASWAADREEQTTPVRLPQPGNQTMQDADSQSLERQETRRLLWEWVEEVQAERFLRST